MSDLSPLQQILAEETDNLDLSVKQFLLKTLIWLPVTFFFWYMAAVAFSFFPIFFSDLILPLVMPGVIVGAEQQSYLVEIITTFEQSAANGQVGEIFLTLNVLKYGYGFPLILAMMMATPESIFDKLDNITYGFLLIVLVQTWGICFEAMTTLLLKMGIDKTTQIGEIIPYTSSDLFLNLLGLGYQLGFLILPAIVPIAFWVLRHQSLLSHFSKSN